MDDCRLLRKRNPADTVSTAVVNLFFASATIVPGALFYRNKEFKFIAIRSFVIQISAGAAAVTAASAEQDYMH